MKKIFEKYDSYIFKKTTATHLALARISLSFFCYMYLSHNTHPDFPSSDFYRIWTPNSLFVFFPSDITAETMTLMRNIFKASLIFMFFGLGTRFMTLLAFISGFCVHGYLTSFSNEVYHHSQMAIFGLFILSLGRVNDSLSLDRLIFRKKFINLNVKKDYGFPLMFLLIWVVSVYFTAGVQKLYFGDGIRWALSQNLRLTLMNTPKLTDLGELITKQPDYVIYFFGLIGLLVEVLSPIALIKRKSLFIFIPLWIGFHFFVRNTFGGHYSFFSQVGCYIALFPFVMHDYDHEYVAT